MESRALSSRASTIHQEMEEEVITDLQSLPKVLPRLEENIQHENKENVERESSSEDTLKEKFHENDEIRQKRLVPPAGTICRYYPLGKCYRGEQCKWIHSYQRTQMVYTPYGPTLVQLPPDAISAVYDVSTGMILANVVPKPTQVCFYWTQNRCKFGNDCKYRHESDLQ